MATDDLNLDDLDDLVALVKAAGVRSVELDPAKVNAPGVWVRFDGIATGTLSGLTLRTTLFLVVPEQDRKRAGKALQELFNKVVPVLRTIGGPSGDTTPAGLALPPSQTPLPALAVPMDLLTINEETP